VDWGGLLGAGGGERAEGCVCVCVCVFYFHFFVVVMVGGSCACVGLAHRVCALSPSHAIPIGVFFVFHQENELFLFSVANQQQTNKPTNPTNQQNPGAARVAMGTEMQAVWSNKEGLGTKQNHDDNYNVKCFIHLIW
jgi:hypothetical protein